MAMLYFTVYKLSCVLAGLVLILLGIRLAGKGLAGRTGELKLSWKDFSVVLTRATPGLVLFAFGTLIIAVTLFKGFEVHEEMGSPGRTPVETDRPNMDSIKISKDSFPIQ